MWRFHKPSGQCLNGITQKRRNLKKMREFLWIVAVWFIAGVMSMLGLFVLWVKLIKKIFGFGQAGRLHPNGSFPFIHRESFVGLVRHRFGLLESVSHDHISQRGIVGFSKRHNRKD